MTTSRPERSTVRAALVLALPVTLTLGLTLTLTLGAGVTAAAGSGRGIDWHLCPGQPTDRCGTVDVPIDYQHPSRGSISLAVISHPASGPGAPEGDLLMNPGGPGESGVTLFPVLLALLPPAVTARYDVVSFDERGTGASDRLRCGPAPVSVVSIQPLPAGGARRLPGSSTYRALARQCVARYGARLGSINSTNAARDMDRIRRALGVRQISFYGLSYGTLLGSVYATLFPDRVHAMVLDGAVDAETSLTTEAAQQAPAIETSLRHFFQTCAAAPTCALKHPATTYRSLEQRLERSPLPGPPGQPPVTAGDLAAATLYALSVPAFTPTFPAAIESAAQGNGSALRALSVGFDEDTDGSSLLAPMWALLCADAPSTDGPVAAEALARRLVRRGGPGSDPLFEAFSVQVDLGGCTSWPKSAQPVRRVGFVAGSGRLPLVVVGNTGDPNTPYRWARRLSSQLGSARLVTYVGWGHTWLLNGSSNPCMRRAIGDYLVSGTVPAAGLRCG